MAKHELSASEWTIIEAVWRLQPCAAPTIQEELDASTGWTYSTVKTMMDRMTKKGLLATERIRNLVIYRAVVTRPEAQQGELMRTVKRAFDGAFTPMMQFVLNTEDLSEEELDQLEALIQLKRGRMGRGQLATDGETRASGRPSGDAQ